LVPALFFLVGICRATVADGPGNKNYVVREVCRVGVPPNSSNKTWQNGSLTFDGKELIVVDPYKKLSLYNVKDLTERIVSENPLLVTAWSDPATGGIFVKMDEEGDRNNVTPRKNTIKIFDLIYFENANAFTHWKPRFTSKIQDNFVFHDEVLHWISGAELFAMYAPEIRPDITFLDTSGNQVGRIQVPGPILGGVDTSDNGLEVYFLSRGTKEATVMRGIVDGGFKKFKRVDKLFVNPGGMRHSYGGTRQIRMRGLKPGDVRKYIELTCQPVYQQRHDLDDLGLDPVQLDVMKFKFGAYYTLGRLSFAESPNEYEISQTGFPRNPFESKLPYATCPILYRRSDGLVMLPSMTSIIDAVLSDETWVVSLRTSINERNGTKEDIFSVCTLATSPTSP